LRWQARKIMSAYGRRLDKAAIKQS
jgi:hypothetical protein